MVRHLDALLSAQIARRRLSKRFILAVLLPPFKLLLAASATIRDWRAKNLISLFRLWVVLPSYLVLMRGGVPLLLFRLDGVDSAHLGRPFLCLRDFFEGTGW